MDQDNINKANQEERLEEFDTPTETTGEIIDSPVY